MIFILFFSILFVNAAYAQDNQTAVNETGESFNEIQNLIDEANQGDSICLKNKTYVGENNPIKINMDINIYGSGSHTVLDANNTSRYLKSPETLK